MPCPTPLTVPAFEPSHVSGDGVDKTEFVLGMLVTLGVITEEDYLPFLNQFERLDSSGDGKLTRDDLKSFVAVNRSKAAKAATQQQQNKRKYQGRIREHAIQLMGPAFIASFGFLWNSIFGFILLAAGLVHGLAIGTILGSEPSKATYMRVAALTVLGGLCFVVGTVFLIVFMISPETYMHMDRPYHHLRMSTISGDGVSVDLPAADESAVEASLREQVEHPAARWGRHSHARGQSSPGPCPSPIPTRALLSAGTALPRPREHSPRSPIAARAAATLA